MWIALPFPECIESLGILPLSPVQCLDETFIANVIYFKQSVKHYCNTCTKRTKQTKHKFIDNYYQAYIQ